MIIFMDEFLNCGVALIPGLFYLIQGGMDEIL